MAAPPLTWGCGRSVMLGVLLRKVPYEGGKVSKGGNGVGQVGPEPPAKDGPGSVGTSQAARFGKDLTGTCQHCP